MGCGRAFAGTRDAAWGRPAGGAAGAETGSEPWRQPGARASRSRHDAPAGAGRDAVNAGGRQSYP